MSGTDRRRPGVARRAGGATSCCISIISITSRSLLNANASASRRRLDALRDLARQVPVTVHGVSLGLVTSGNVSEERLGRLARLVERVEPDHWSEHLAFVRAGGIEIGHLAAAPYAPQHTRRRNTESGTGA